MIHDTLYNEVSEVFDGPPVSNFDEFLLFCSLSIATRCQRLIDYFEIDPYVVYQMCFFQDFEELFF